MTSDELRGDAQALEVLRGVVDQWSLNGVQTDEIERYAASIPPDSSWGAGRYMVALWNDLASRDDLASWMVLPSEEACTGIAAFFDGVHLLTRRAIYAAVARMIGLPLDINAIEVLLSYWDEPAGDASMTMPPPLSAEQLRSLMHAAATGSLSDWHPFGDAESIDKQS